jgi:hypothetical protein
MLNVLRVFSRSGLDYEVGYIKTGRKIRLQRYCSNVSFSVWNPMILDELFG